MARLTAFFICSLDLRIADAAGDFRWAAPPESVHALVNERERGVGTYLYGRRLWETMRFWETTPDDGSVPGDYGVIWRQADKIVHSRTLSSVDTARTRLEHDFDPEAVRRLKTEASSDLTVGGADLAAQAMRAGLVDELILLLVPAMVGEGPRAIPDGVAHRLALEEEQVLEEGWVLLRYSIRAGTP